MVQKAPFRTEGVLEVRQRGEKGALCAIIRDFYWGTFFQSLRNPSTAFAVLGLVAICWITLKGMVAISTPIFANSVT